MLFLLNVESSGLARKKELNGPRADGKKVLMPLNLLGTDLESQRMTFCFGLKVFSNSVKV